MYLAQEGKNWREKSIILKVKYCVNRYGSVWWIIGDYTRSK